MKILLVAERYWPEVGAAPSRLANMAEGLVKQGCEVDVLTSLPNYPKGRIFDGYRGCVSNHEIHGNVNLFRYWIFATVSRNPIFRILNMFSFAVMIWLFAFKRKRIRSYDCVIIQTPTLVVAKSAMMLFKGLYGKKCVLNVSDIWPLTAVDMGAMKMGSRSWKYMASLEKYLYKHTDGVLGQSEEILNHVAQDMLKIKGKWTDNNTDTDEVLNSKLWTENKKLFLYRNLQTYNICEYKTKNPKLKLVFSGMLGVAQDVAGIVKNVPWKELGVEFYIIGGGKQLEEIQSWIANNPDSGVFAYGFVPKEEIALRLKEMDASIVPLATRIRGAFPSKVFDILPQGLPILFCGGGEGATFISSHKVGFVSTPGDYNSLIDNVKQMRDMSAQDYEAMSSRCVRIGKEELDFEKQMKETYDFLSNIIR
ncbi:MAG: glycosyltransferase family 4 protein [Bacteroidales bacterium]|nr:glycosyltransferase family 4 protein [Bacteroidales bacterium]